MDNISRDVLFETKQVLCDLAELLDTIRTAQNGNVDPRLSEMEAELRGFASRLPSAEIIPMAFT